MAKKASKKEINRLFKSGNFTLVFYNSSFSVLYKGKRKLDNLPLNGGVEEFRDINSDGHVPLLVKCLVKALSGRVLSV